MFVPGTDIYQPTSHLYGADSASNFNFNFNFNYHDRPQVFVPGTDIYRRNELSKEMAFLELGMIEVGNADLSSDIRCHSPPFLGRAHLLTTNANSAGRLLDL